jgi:hypothetical protein
LRWAGITEKKHVLDSFFAPEPEAPLPSEECHATVFLMLWPPLARDACLTPKHEGGNTIPTPITRIGCNMENDGLHKVGNPGERPSITLVMVLGSLADSPHATRSCRRGALLK